MQSLNIVIVEKNGSLKPLAVKEFNEDELFKKCGFKKADDFSKRVEWSVKVDKVRYIVSVFAKDTGRAGGENKFDFPPPIDNSLFFGSCAVIAQMKNNDGKKVYTDLSIPLWSKIYEKLFGGFEDLAATAAEDENEVDELENVSKEKKTKHGYLKDGFVVDSECDCDDEEAMESSDLSDLDDSGEDTTNDEEDNASETSSDIVYCNELCEDEYDD